jgi:hypothetical protein
MGRPNNERFMLLIFPFITLSLFLVAIVIAWITHSVLPALGLLGGHA